MGDLCDNCPDTLQYNKNQLDTDQDGVGDACDLCPGDHPYGAQSADIAQPCTFSPATDADDQHCRTVTGNPDSVCTYLGACTEAAKDSSAYNGADSDGDKIGNAWDGCPTTPNPYGSQTQPNCNIDVELINGSYPFMTDECDPCPCGKSA